MKHIGNLKHSEGAKNKRKRIARGQGSGHGGTATRGHKGQKSRAGAKIGIAFEGGQMPLNRRLPKFGFYNPFRVEYQEVNIKRLQELADADKLEGGKVNFDVLLKLGVINHKSKPVKILGDGDISAPLTVEAHKFTNSAKEKIESAGGTVTING